MRRLWIPVAGLVTACVACARPSPPAPRPEAGSIIDTIALRAHTSFLAHDHLEGRETGQRGAAVAAAYIAAQCRALGLGPLGSTYALEVPLEQAVVNAAATTLRVRHGRDTAAFIPGPDFLVTGGTPAALDGFGGPLVFVGSGDHVRRAPDSLPPLRGAVAVTAGPVHPDAARLLHGRGAVGLLHLLGDEEEYGLYRASRGLALTLLADAEVPSSFHPPLPALLVAPHVARALLPGLRARVPPSASVRIAVHRRPVLAWNVACVLPGAERRLVDTPIAFTAHYDHLGISTPDARGDSVYNGFSDNAAGVAMLLAIAGAAGRSGGSAFRHPLVFLFFTGEERGLLGSDYFVARPPIPLSRLRAVINLDAGAPPGRPWNWRIAGGEGTTIGALARDVAAERGWAATVSPATPNSDYYPFARHGIPAVFPVPGPGPYEGLSADSSQALRGRWDRYHQAADEYDAAFPFAGIQRYAEFAWLLARAIDAGRLRPE